MRGFYSLNKTKQKKILFISQKKIFVCKQKIQHAVQKKKYVRFFFDSYGSVHVGRNKNGGNLFLFEIENSLITKNNEKKCQQLRFRKIKTKWINNECKKFFKNVNYRCSFMNFVEFFVQQTNKRTAIYFVSTQ